MSNKSLLEFNNLEKDYLKWCKEYFAYKVLTFDKDSVSDDFDVVEMEEKIIESVYSSCKETFKLPDHDRDIRFLLHPHAP